MSLHAIRRALSASVLTARRPWLANYDPFYTAANGLRENLDDRLCHHPGAPGTRVANASRLAAYRVGLAGPASPRESVNKISVCGDLGGHRNRGFEYISLGWVCQPASRNQTPNICRARGLSLYRDFPVRRVPEQPLMRDYEAF